MKRGICPFLAGFCLALISALVPSGAGAETRVYSFGVMNHSSVSRTAQYWNPILQWVGRRAGVTIELGIGRSMTQTDTMIRNGEFDFVYSGTIFSPAAAQNGYRVIARTREPDICGQIFVLADAPAKSLQDLAGREVAFASPRGFLAYAVPMDGLMRAGVEVNPLFAGNQEGALSQLIARRVVAATASAGSARDFENRKGVRLRALWTSDAFPSLPVAAHPRVPPEVIRAVRDALVAMADDPVGRSTLSASATRIRQTVPVGFQPATDRDFEAYRRFYRTTLLKDLE
jgi:phosphonate transport system substrate-binding protein